MTDSFWPKNVGGVCLHGVWNVWCSSKPMKGAWGAVWWVHWPPSTHNEKSSWEKNYQNSKLQGSKSSTFLSSWVAKCPLHNHGKECVCCPLFPNLFWWQNKQAPHPLREKAPLFGEVEMGVECEAQTTIDSTSFCTFGPNESKEG